jgi:hypothetical protein
MRKYNTDNWCDVSGGDSVGTGCSRPASASSVPLRCVGLGDLKV